MINWLDAAEEDCHSMIFPCYLSVPLLEDIALIAGAAGTAKAMCIIPVHCLGREYQDLVYQLGKSMHVLINLPGTEKCWPCCWKLKMIPPPGLWSSFFLTDPCMMCCCLPIPLLEEVRESPVLQWEQGNCCWCCWIASNAGLCQSNTSEPFEISFSIGCDCAVGILMTRGIMQKTKYLWFLISLQTKT